MTLFENNVLMTTKQNGLVEDFSVNVGESDSLLVIIPSRDVFTTTQGMAKPVGVKSEPNTIEPVQKPPGSLVVTFRTGPQEPFPRHRTRDRGLTTGRGRTVRVQAFI